MSHSRTAARYPCGPRPIAPAARPAPLRTQSVERGHGTGPTASEPESDGPRLRASSVAGGALGLRETET